MGFFHKANLKSLHQLLCGKSASLFMIAKSSFLSSITSVFDKYNIPDRLWEFFDRRHLIDGSWNDLLVYVNSEKMVIWNHTWINHSFLPYSPLKINKWENKYHTKLYITSKILKSNMLHLVVCTINIMGLNRCMYCNSQYYYNTERVTDMLESM